MKSAVSIPVFALNIALIAALSLSACGGEKGAAAAAAKPVIAMAIGHSECGACGMVVAEQPSPRGQLVHRDGTREFFCSVDDMRQYLMAPSAHGSAVGQWVEGLPMDFDPAARDRAAQPWVDVASVQMVTGVTRPGVMGPPVLTFETKDTAEDAIGRHGGTMMVWTEYLKGETL